MGNCCCFGDISLTKSAVAIKFPHGVAGVQYSEDLNHFIHCKDINEWLQSLYLHSDSTKWVLYNDETDDIVEKGHHTKGHCKGIVTWGDTSISWLCHSVPNFPREFTGKTISLIESSELVYGQSFQYIELPYHNDTLIAIMKQLSIMQANIYVANHDLTFQTSHVTVLATNHRYLIARIKAPGFQYDVLTGQALDSGYPHEQRQAWWKQLQEVLDNRPQPHYPIVALVDANAR